MQTITLQIADDFVPTFINLLLSLPKGSVKVIDIKNSSDSDDIVDMIFEKVKLLSNEEKLALIAMIEKSITESSSSHPNKK